MPTPKRHHYVPQMILNGFTDRDGWLHWYRLAEARAIVRKARPAQLFLQNHLYSAVSETGIKDTSTERALSLLEAAAARVVQDILTPARAGRCPTLSADQMYIWHVFFLTQWRRTPENQQAVVSDSEASRMITATLDRLRAMLPGRRCEIDALYTPEAKARVARNARIDTLKQPGRNVLGVLERRGVAVLHIRRRNKGFIIGSRPVVKLSVQGQSDLRHPTVEMWLPIASDVAVGVGGGDGGISLHILSDERPIRQLNMAMASQSSVIAGRSAALVRSLANPR